MDNKKLGRNSKICCSVEGCTNTYANTESDIKFYNFPNRWYETERKKIWIQRIKRDSLWQPKKHNKVCSVHFIGNSKSNNPKSPSYNPTIFPKHDTVMSDSDVESAHGGDNTNTSETDTADENDMNDIEDKQLGQFDFVDVKDESNDYSSNDYLPEDVNVFDIKEECDDESQNIDEFTIKVEPCDLSKYEEKPDIFTLENFNYIEEEHNYCIFNDSENDIKIADFWRKEVKKLKEEIYRKNDEIRSVKDEVESIRNQIASNNKILKRFLKQKKTKGSTGATNKT